MARGKLITIEGLDGAGKTTLAGSLVRELERRGVPVRLLREPGGVDLSERVRALVKDPALAVGARTEALLYAAARAELVEQAVRPLLDSGSWVLLDRFVDSSLAYQGAGRGLGVEAIRALNAFGTGGLTPDRTLLLDLDPTVGRARQAGRREASDRLERGPDEFFDRISAGYRELARAEPDRIRAIDAAADEPAVLRAALEALADLLAHADPPHAAAGAPSSRRSRRGGAGERPRRRRGSR